jgi:hypothetical protein
LNTSLKLPIKSESIGNERDVYHFMYWRKYDIKKNAEYLLDDKEIQHKKSTETLNVPSYQVTKI